MHTFHAPQFYSNRTLDADELHVLGFALNNSQVAPNDAAPVARAFADAMALILIDTNDTVNGTTKLSSMLPAQALNGVDWDTFQHVRIVLNRIIDINNPQQMVMAMETLHRAQTVFGFTNLGQSNLPVNMTQFFNDVIATLRIAVLRQALVLVEEYSVDDIPTFIANLAGSMRMTAATPGPSVALLQSLSNSQGRWHAQRMQHPHVPTAQATVTALAAYGLSAYLSALSGANIVNDANAMQVLIALSALP